MFSSNHKFTCPLIMTFDLIPSISESDMTSLCSVETIWLTLKKSIGHLLLSIYVVYVLFQQDTKINS